MIADDLLWPVARLAEGFDALARASGLPAQVARIVALGAGDEDTTSRWLEAAAREMGLEAEPVVTTYRELDEMLAGLAPGILRIPAQPEARFVLLVGRGDRAVSAIARDHSVVALSLDALRAELCREPESAQRAWIDSVLDVASVAESRRERARAAILREQLRHHRISGAWVLRVPAGAPIKSQLRELRLGRRLALLFVLMLASHSMRSFSWWMLAKGAFGGRADHGWLVGWILALVAGLPFGIPAFWVIVRLAVDIAAMLKQRLMLGSLRIDPAEVRKRGIGQLLGLVLECEAVETIAVASSLTSLSALVDLLFAFVVLALGAAGVFHVLALLLWCALAVLFAIRYVERRRAWSEGPPSPAGAVVANGAGRVGMTHDLIEKMVGYRTRLAQERPEDRHTGEDEALSHYLALSADMDRWSACLSGLIPRGWLVLGLLMLVPASLSPDSPPELLAISLAGILLGYRSLGTLATDLPPISDALIAWKSVEPLFHAAGEPETLGSTRSIVDDPSRSMKRVIEAHSVGFRHEGRLDPVLRDVTLEASRGDRILLTGPSGGGKSTLASILLGLRAPESGIVLLGGLDPATLGAREWRRRAVGAPQFHENHVFADTFAANALLGCDWPPKAPDLRALETLSRDLGLGRVLDNMPGGLKQMVGETGWQLSHGERGRLFLARALLQPSELIVLDESFGALDPDTLGKALRCVMDRTKDKVLLVIAHP